MYDQKHINYENIKHVYKIVDALDNNVTQEDDLISISSLNESS